MKPHSGTARREAEKMRARRHGTNLQAHRSIPRWECPARERQTAAAVAL
jgi:hypothetical protein